MPGRDQTGPTGTGPNGRGLGPCRNEDANSSFFGFGRRGGRGRRGGGGRGMRGFWRSESKESLQAEESFLKKRLSEIQDKLKD